MQNYRMTVQYDGTRYNGWQKQKDTDNTIQYKLEAILSRLLESPVAVHGAGRTDAGVHAKGQVAQFRLDDVQKDLLQKKMKDGDSSENTPDDADFLCRYLNEYLPEDIGVLSVRKAAPRFHSRYNASSKHYRYRIGTNKAAHVFDRKYVYEYDGHLDVVAMKVATIQLRGEHDFSSFNGNPHMKKSKVKTIYNIRITETPYEIDIDFFGSGFLQYMVRILVGTLIEVGEGKRDPQSFDALLAAKDRKLAGPTAPACGLTLEEVYYN